MKSTGKILFNPNDYFSSNETLIIAVSGGVDSMVLLDMVSTLANPLVIAHVNHKKRKQSDVEFKALQSHAKALNIPFEGHVITSPTRRNFQDFARKERLKFFSRIAKKYNAQKVVLAHHRDDQIETICMRYTHSMNILDLSGMHPVQCIDDMILLRPLLTISKKEILDYSNMYNIKYFEDISNLDLRYTRNRFRHVIIPTLRSKNDNFDAMILQLHKDVNCLKDRLKNLASYYLKLWDKVPIDEFLELNPFLQEVFMKHYLGKHNQKFLTRKHLKSFIHQLKTTKNFVYKLSDAVSVHKEYNYFFLNEQVKSNHRVVEINDLGTYKVDSQLSFVVTDHKNTHISSNYCVLWYNDIVFPLYIRTRRKGDKISQSFGTKKVKDLFIDKKVSPLLRDKIFLLTNQKEVLWIPFLKLYKYQPEKKRKIYIYEVDHARERY